jgi:hypothetical protein
MTRGYQTRSVPDLQGFRGLNEVRMKSARGAPCR